MSDFNLVNFLIDKDREDKKIKLDDGMDTSMWDYNPPSDDFLNFDTFLRMDEEDVEFNLLENTTELFAENTLDAGGPPLDGSVYSDSGVSSSLSPPYLLYDDDQNLSNMVTSDKMDINGSKGEDTFMNKKDLDVDILSDTSTTDTILIDVAPDSVETLPDSDSSFVFTPTTSTKSSSKQNRNKSIHIPASKRNSNFHNSKSILIPVNLPGVKTIKVVSASGKRLTSESFDEINNRTGLAKKFKFLSGDSLSIGSPCQSVSTSCTEDDDEESDSIYPRLELTYEERRLMEKEGVRLPSHYPLTKLEERELKRIRRKIRNKISAQDSRKRKKEYVDGLEERVKKCSEENIHLMKRIKLLESRNHGLSTQLRKMHALLTNRTKVNHSTNTNTNNTNTTTNTNGANNSSQVQSSTCLMVLCLSLALILAPNLQNGSLSDTVNNVADSLNEMNLPLEKNIQDSTSGRSRSLLFTKYALQQKVSPLMAEMKNSELVEEAYTKFLNSQSYGSDNGGDTSSDDKERFPKVNQNGPPPTDADGGGLSGLLTDLSELLNFQGKNVRDEIKIKNECFANGYNEEYSAILYNDHNYGKPMRKKTVPNWDNDSPVDDFLPIKKANIEPIFGSLLDETSNRIKNEILDSPVDDYRPNYRPFGRERGSGDRNVREETMRSTFNQSKRE